MVTDKSLWFYGWTYHKLFDRPLAEGRRLAADLVTPGSSVLDVACGTGELCAALSDKHCRVVGVDLSCRMLRFAQTRVRSGSVSFQHLDATDLGAFSDRSFDFATLLFLVHELTREQQLRVLAEATRVARSVIVADAAAPLPRNAGALGIWVVEATFGRDHYHQFRAFLAGGGISGILTAAQLPLAVAHRGLFWGGCREIVMLTH